MDDLDKWLEVARKILLTCTNPDEFILRIKEQEVRRCLVE